MTQVGEGQQADEIAPPVMTFGAPTAGEILAERYELVEHINDDSAGRQVWRGIDVVLRRPVAVVLRYPGGESATEMLQAAVAASRVVHPNLVGVYDAIDEGDRAYVVREWIEGRSLREMVAEEILDPGRATTIGHAVAGALAAVHATGMVHGNVHPGTVMISYDGRVVLSDARSDGIDTVETDVRAIGGVLYFALTGHWPYAEAPMHGAIAGQGRAAIPDARRDSGGSATAPRQVRAGIPTYLDELTMGLLDTAVPPPSSEMLAAELSRLDVPAEDQYFENTGPLRFTASTEEEGSPFVPAGSRKIVLGLAGLLAIALVGLLVGIGMFGGDGDEKDPTPAASASQQPLADSSIPAVQPAHRLTLGPDQVRVIDPDGKKRDEFDGIEKVIDGNMDEGWDSDSYYSADFSHMKTGMGVWIDLKEPHNVKSVQVVFSTPGASAQLYTGTVNPPSTSSGDKALWNAYKKSPIGEPYEQYQGTTMMFDGFEAEQKYQYLLLWITELPAVGPNKYKIGVQEITVHGR